MILRRRWYLSVGALLAVSLACAAAVRAATSFEFASVDEGRAVVTARDDYVQRLGALERALRAKSENPVSETEFLQLLANAVRPWSDADRAAVQDALAMIRAPLAELGLPLPSTVFFVKTSGAGESAPHTRGNAMIVPEQVLKQPPILARLLAHELFHIASRQNKDWRDAMYSTIGFVPIEEVAIPAPLAARRITNPDAPRIDAAIKVLTDDGPVWVAPLLQSTADSYDAAKGGELFAYLKLVWLEVARGERTPQRADLQQVPRMRSTAELRGFEEQIGRNTGYVIHPEEILADNFAQLATGQAARSPEVHQRLREALRRHAPDIRR